MLKVVLQAPRRLTDPYSGNPGASIPGQYAQFRSGHFESTDKSVIRIMVEKFYLNKQRNMLTTFWPHPEDTDNAEKLWSRIQDTSSTAEGMVMDKDDALRQSLAENDRLRRELAKAQGNKRANKMKASIVEMDEDADEEETINPTGQEALSPDDVDDSNSEG